MDINRRKIAQVAIDRLRFKLLWRSKSLKKSSCRLNSLESAERDEDHRCSTSTSLILIKRNLRWKSSALPIVRSASNRCGWKSFPESFRWNSRPTIRDTNRLDIRAGTLSLFANFQGSSRAIVEKFRTSDSRAKMKGGETLRNSYYHSVNCY